MIEQALIFLGFEIVFLLLPLIIYSFYKNNWKVKGFMDSWRKAEGDKPLWKGISIILLAPIILALILHIPNAKAEEITYFNNATVFVGIDKTMNISPLCVEGGISDRLTSNIGATQNVASYGPIDIELKYTHHSCALNLDRNSYDSYGLVLVWNIW